MQGEVSTNKLLFDPEIAKTEGRTKRKRNKQPLSHWVNLLLLILLH